MANYEVKDINGDPFASTAAFQTMLDDLQDDTDANTAFKATPSTIITAGTNLSWSGNTLNASGTGGTGNEVLLSSIATADDSTESVALTNFNALVAAVDDGDNIVVDGLFYLNIGTTELVSDRISMRGQGDAELSFVYSGADGSKPSIFELGPNIKSVSIKDIKWTNPNATQQPRIIGGGTQANNDFDCELLEFENNIFDGLFCVFTATCKANVTSEFKDIRIVNNRFLECTDIDFATYWSISNINLENFSYDRMVIRDNYAINCWNVIYDGIVNGNTGTEKDLCVIENNHMYEDNSWFLDGQSDGYHCFILCEATTIEYRYNHVEGLKTNHADAVCYDAYLTGSYVTYENNTYKNICKMITGTYGSVIWKAKTIPTGIVGKRVYRNNTVYVEKTWLDAIEIATGDSITSKYQLADFPSNVSSTLELVDVSNNNVHVEHKLDLTTACTASSVRMNGNTVKAIEFDGYPMFLYQTSGTYDVYNIAFTNNNYTEIDLAKDNFTSALEFLAFIYATDEITIDNLFIDNVYFQAYGEFNFCWWSGTPTINSARISNIKVDCNGDNPTTTELYSTSYWDGISASQNILYIEAGTTKVTVGLET